MKSVKFWQFLCIFSSVSKSTLKHLMRQGGKQDFDNKLDEQDFSRLSRTVECGNIKIIFPFEVSCDPRKFFRNSPPAFLSRMPGCFQTKQFYKSVHLRLCKRQQQNYFNGIYSLPVISKPCFRSSNNKLCCHWFPVIRFPQFCILRLLIWDSDKNIKVIIFWKYQI